MVRLERPRYRLIGLLGGALGTAIAVLGILPGLVLNPVASSLRDDEPPAPADVIVVLGGGSSRRPIKALELARSGYSSRIAITSPGPGPEEEEYSSTRWPALLEAAGFPGDSIDTLSPSYSTFDDARLVGELLMSRRASSALVVTDPFHTLRAGWIIRRALESVPRPDRPLIRIVACDEPPSGTAVWWRDETRLVAVATEYAKLAFYAAAYGLRGPLAGAVGFHREAVP